MEYYVEYRYDNDIKENFLQNEIALKFKRVKWKFDDNFYIIEYDESKPYCGYFSDEFILVLFIEDSPIHSHPNNLVLYNLKKEIFKIIQAPKPLHYKGNNLLPISSIGKVKIIDNVKHLLVVISTGGYDMGFSEFRYLNLETFEYHPTYYEVQELFGQYSKTPTRWEEYGR
ncbi:hypothetical protein P0M11_10135 [Kaistella sp. PBT33-4]|uniref:hypothetical protein n=1 Tax=Kaistella sp. PBT33-4 TaxID=3032000 RepID=UPI0023D8BFAB|nr:hypothetical protein [Kaistella sp. PBT33-4]MDF0720353.1 hypothetical protein [Kaistella sp. PBT33-4]